MVAQADNTLVAIRKKIRRLTVSSSESVQKTDTIDEYINTFYSNDFAYSIKLDQMRSVYTFFTQPYVDRYPLDVNYNQGVRDPVYFNGIQGYLFKSRDDYYRMWPRLPTKFTPINGDGVTTDFTFTIPGPFLANEVTIGGVDVNGTAISVMDDGKGNLYLQTPNPVTSVPSITSTAPGMYNRNTGNPGQDIQTPLQSPTPATSSVDYVTGAFQLSFPVAPAAGSVVTVFVSQYQPGRPYTLLFWNNEFTVRPVPTLVHKVEVEVYLTPTQFMSTTDSPILNQWVQYIAYGASMEILRDRQDFDGVDSLMEGFKRQEAMVLERQGVEEINQRNTTIFSATVMSQGSNNGFGQGWM